jgi:Fe-S-cluster containining protein
MISRNHIRHQISWPSPAIVHLPPSLQPEMRSACGSATPGFHGPGLSEPMNPADIHPCTSCGACCAHYRVSIHWLEASQRGLPADDLIPVTPHLVCLPGTAAAPVRCGYLEGSIGSRTSCSVYASRPSPCREVMPGDAHCLKARAAHGLPPL